MYSVLYLCNICVYILAPVCLHMAVQCVCMCLYCVCMHVFTQDNNENPLHSTDRYQVDGNSGEISFRPLHKEDEGVYHCRAYNEVGEDHGQISLTVRGTLIDI